MSTPAAAAAAAADASTAPPPPPPKEEEHLAPAHPDEQQQQQKQQGHTMQQDPTFAPQLKPPPPPPHDPIVQVVPPPPPPPLPEQGRPVAGQDRDTPHRLQPHQQQPQHFLKPMASRQFLRLDNLGAMTPSWDYESFPWMRIFRYFADDPATYEDVGRVCVHFRAICQSEYSLRAAYFVLRTCRHMAFHYVYTQHPSALSHELMDALIEELKVPVPKRLVEIIFKEQQETPEPPAVAPDGDRRLRGSTSRLFADIGSGSAVAALAQKRKDRSTQNTRGRWRRPLPPGTLEHIVAYGFKLYGDTLLLDLPSPEAENASSSPTPPASDEALFHAALAPSHPDVPTLKTILFHNHYLPALDRPRTADEWDDFWFKCLKLYRVDVDLGRHVYNHSGWPGPPQAASDALIARALRDPGTTDTFLKFLGTRAGGGHRVTREACVRVLASPSRIMLDSIPGMSALDLMRTCVPGGEETLKGHARAALAVLFRDGRRDAVRAIDTLLMEFELSEEDVGMALLADGMKDDVDPDLSTPVASPLVPAAAPGGVLAGGDCPGPVTAYSRHRSSVPLAPSPASPVSPASVVPSLFAPTTTSSMKSPLPFMTALGQVQGGMTDMLWQLILARYGLSHPFTAACVVDLVIGGTLKNPVAVIVAASSPQRQNGAASSPPSSPSSVAGAAAGAGMRRNPRSRYSVMMENPLALAAAAASASAGAGASAGTAAVPAAVWIDEDHDDRDRDTAARDSLEALLEGAGVPVDPGMMAPISKAVLALRMVRPRVLDFMARIERALLRASFDPYATEADRLRWSRVRWVASLRRHVLDHRSYLEHVLSPSELAAMDEQRRRGRRAPERTSGIFSGKMFAAQPQVHAQGGATAGNGFGGSGGGDAGAGGAGATTATAASTAAAIARSLVGGLVRSTRPRGASFGGSSQHQHYHHHHHQHYVNGGGGGGSAGAGAVGATSVVGAGLLSSVVDLVDREFAEVRRFFGCVERLVAVLEAPRPGLHRGDEVSGLQQPPSGFSDAEGPFTAWLREVDAKAAQKAAKEHARAVQLQLAQGEAAAAAASSSFGGGFGGDGDVKSVWDGFIKGTWR
ncbi:hypothetical protein DFJ73DRAFT_939398 [Zopfochytrium polystomum]|nr:hypothetical protein DFJ73DRAFT_939398 [Zopfochytrium polystomum]